MLRSLRHGRQTGGLRISAASENGGSVNLRSDLAMAVTISYCKDLTCKSFFWSDSIKSGRQSSDSMVADGSRLRFVVTVGWDRIESELQTSRSTMSIRMGSRSLLTSSRRTAVLRTLVGAGMATTGVAVGMTCAVATSPSIVGIGACALAGATMSASGVFLAYNGVHELTHLHEHRRSRRLRHVR